MATGRLPTRSPASKSRPLRSGMPIVSNQPGVVAFSQSEGRIAGHRPIADADHAGCPTAPGEQPYRGDRRRTDAWDGRRRIAQALDARTALLGRPATRLEVQFRHEQWLRHEAERQLVERRKRTKEQSGGDDQDE